jgi:hypothetical protein
MYPTGNLITPSNVLSAAGHYCKTRPVMPLKSEPDIPLDPVSGFFAGFTSVFARMFIGLGAFVAGYLVCSFAEKGWNVYSFAGFPLRCIFSIFDWADLGGGFVIGMAALISIFAGLWAFVHDSEGKRSFFFIFTASTVYFASHILSEDARTNIYNFEPPPPIWVPLTWAAGIYAAASVCYWVVPRMIAAFANRNAEDEIETVAPIPEEEHHTSEATSDSSRQSEATPDTDPSPAESSEYPPTGAEPLKHPADEEETDS